MIVDNPHVMREVIGETKPRFTHPGAEEIYTTKKDQMDAYAARWGELADRVWKKDYLNQQSDEHASTTKNVSGENRKRERPSAVSAG